MTDGGPLPGVRRAIVAGFIDTVLSRTPHEVKHGSSRLVPGLFRGFFGSLLVSVTTTLRLFEVYNSIYERVAPTFASSGYQYLFRSLWRIRRVRARVSDP